MGLDIVEMVIAIEQRFQLRFPDELATRLLTVGQTRDEVVRVLVARGKLDTALLRASVWDALVQIIVEQMRLEPEDIRPESRWIPDISDTG
jgi:acyl carrier protein